MNPQSFTQELESLDLELEEALLLDPKSFQTGRAARAYWNFMSRCINELFGIITTADNAGLLLASDDHVLDSLRRAEEEIARGFLRLALLLADSEIHEKMSDEFHDAGIIHPFHSHLGFKIRHNPKLSRKFRRFMDKQIRRGKSLDQVKRDMRVLFNNLDQEL